MLSHSPLGSSINTGAPPAAFQTLAASSLVKLGDEFNDLSSQLVRDSDPIGSGGYSDVFRGWLVRSSSQQSPVAVKVLRITQKRGLERTLKHLRREVIILRRANHENVAKVLGIAHVGDTAVRPAIVLQWYENGVAPAFLQGRMLKEKLVIIRDIASGLTYLHSQNIVHGDLKGCNVLITAAGHAVISDFGLSRVIGYHTGGTTSSMPGSVSWQSPELVKPFFTDLDTDILKTKESDVWALASTVYELILEHEPYSQLSSPGANRHVVMMRIATAIYKGTTPLMIYNGPVGVIPNNIQTILQRCWAYPPFDRPEMEEILKLFL